MASSSGPKSTGNDASESLAIGSRTRRPAIRPSAASMQNVRRARARHSATPMSATPPAMPSATLVGVATS